MGISKKSVNTGIMRIGLVCSIIAAIIICRWLIALYVLWGYICLDINAPAYVVIIFHANKISLHWWENKRLTDKIIEYDSLLIKVVLMIFNLLLDWPHGGDPSEIKFACAADISSLVEISFASVLSRAERSEE